MSKQTAAVVLCVLALTACASVPMAPPDSDRVAKAFATAPDKANLYVYRNEHLGATIRLPVLIDGVSAGNTAAMTYIYRQLEPGSHVLTSKGENDATLAVDLQPGQNYFVWQEVKVGMWSARTQLHLVDTAKGEAGVGESQRVQ